MILQYWNWSKIEVFGGIVPGTDRVHNVEIELKARIRDRKLIEEKLAHFMSFRGEIHKSDEYWEIPGAHCSESSNFRLRLRSEPGRLSATFKEKSFDGSLEINREYEFTIDGEPSFRAFVERLKGTLVYRKQKMGTRWGNDRGLVAEVVEVSTLGLFLEVECVCDDRDAIAQEEAKLRLFEVIDKCGIPRKSLEARPYSQLLGY